MQRFAIIGAGLAGASLARRLLDEGKDVAVFEKSRGTGGRLASAKFGAVSGDLGMDYIEAHSPDFERFLIGLEHQGVLERWDQTIWDFHDQRVDDAKLWVGRGRNSTLTRALLEGAELHTEVRIGVIWRDRDGVLLRDVEAQSLGYFDAVICAAPAPQAQPLLEVKPRFAEVAARAKTLASWTQLFELERLPARLQGKAVVRGESPVFDRIVVEATKPGRKGLVVKVQMSPAWSQENLSLHTDTIAAEIKTLVEDWSGEAIKPTSQRTHRWLYSSSFQPEPEQENLWDADLGIGACGDWIAEPGIEGSWLTAQRLADQILQRVMTAA